MDFGSELETQLRELVTEFADVTHEPQELAPHRGIFDHKILLAAYLKRQRCNRKSVLEYEELKRQCTDLSRQGLVRVSNCSYGALIVMVRKLDGSFRLCVYY